MTTRQIMLWVLLALVPGTAMMTFHWGLGVLWNLAGLTIFGLAIEAAISMLRSQPPTQGLNDGTTLVSMWLIAIALPPSTSIHALLLAAVASIALAKHAYGGLGHNVFNPAMVGYAVVLVSFPAELAQWPATDGLTGATLLTEYRFREGVTNAEFGQAFQSALDAQLSIAIAFLAGGALLAYRRFIAWRTTAGLLLSLGVCALLGYDQGSSQSLGSPWHHWLSGGMIIAAFFIVTDPVTHPYRHAHQWLFGIIVGTVTFCIRTWGVYPDGIAFAVLLANCVTPFLNRLAQRQEPSHA